MTTTPGHFRAVIAERQLMRYHLAVEVGVHPTRLGQMLLGRIPMPAEVVRKLSEVLARHEQQPA